MIETAVQVSDPLDRISIAETSSLADTLRGVYEFSCGLLDMLDGGAYEMPLIQVHATLDDVGNEKDGISAVVGYAAYSQEWSRFNGRWIETLLQLNGESLHTAKYLHKFWLSDHDMTDEDICLMLAPFIETVKATLLAGGAIPICVITDNAAYEQLTDQEKKYVRPPAENSFEIAVALACRALRHPLHISNAIAIQMDESANAPKLYARYEAMKRENPEFKDHLGSLCFCDDQKHPPVQAADMLANVVLKSFRRFEKGEGQPRAIRELTGGKLTVHRYRLDNLRRLAQMRIQRKNRMEIAPEE